MSMSNMLIMPSLAWQLEYICPLNILIEIYFNNFLLFSLKWERKNFKNLTIRNKLILLKCWKVYFCIFSLASVPDHSAKFFPSVMSFMNRRRGCNVEMSAKNLAKQVVKTSALNLKQVGHFTGSYFPTVSTSKHLLYYPLVWPIRWVE